MNDALAKVIAQAKMPSGGTLLASDPQIGVLAAAVVEFLTSDEAVYRVARAVHADYVARYPEEPPVYHAGPGQPVWRHIARAALLAAVGGSDE